MCESVFNAMRTQAPSLPHSVRATAEEQEGWGRRRARGAHSPRARGLPPRCWLRDDQLLLVLLHLLAADLRSAPPTLSSWRAQAQGAPTSP